MENDLPELNFDWLIEIDLFKHAVTYFDNGQKRSEQFFTDGSKLYKEIFYSENGHIREIVNYKLNTNDIRRYYFADEKVKSGMTISYHENGIVQSQKYYVDGKIHWEEKFFSESGQLLEVINYKKGIKSGLHKMYTERGILLSEINFEGSIPNGESRFYYDNGLTKALINYRMGKKDGISKFYYDNGIMKIEENFEDDIREGFVKTFYKSGGLKEEWSVHQGLPEGKCNFYYKTGMIYGIKNYKGGKEEGLSRFYYENGKIKEEINYLHGLKNGLYKFYTPGGRLEKEIIFQEGEPIQQTELEIKNSDDVYVPTRKENAIRTMNYIGISAAIIIALYLVYSLLIYLFG